MVEHSACESAALHLFFLNHGVHIWKGWVSAAYWSVWGSLRRLFSLVTHLKARLGLECSRFWSVFHGLFKQDTQRVIGANVMHEIF
jgi:hypothetical protein